ncbi:MAG: hypothetical protein ACRD1C_03095 [Terriglobales bacterium]
MRIPNQLRRHARRKPLPEPLGGRPGLTAALPDCSYYPTHLDPARRVVHFSRIPRQVYRNEAFLTPRAGDLGGSSYTFNLDDLLLAGAQPPPGQIHFILISAFCCSTLLARYCDRVPCCHVLREPGVLGQLAILRHTPPVSVRGGWDGEWPRLSELGMSLLARTFEPNETVIIKAADVSNNMAGWLSRWQPNSRFVLLSVPLRLFILSVLKQPGRREWARQRARFWRREAQTTGVIPDFDVAQLDDARKAAYLWLVTQILWRTLRAQVAPERVLALDAEEVSATPRATMGRLGTFLSIPITETELDSIAASEIGSRHAKNPSRGYTASERAGDIEIWEARFGAEADAAEQWAERVAAEAVQ